MNVKKIRPLFNRIVTSAFTYMPEEGELITDKEAKGALKEVQIVVSVGESVRGINVGDLVKIDPRAYEVKKYRDGSIKEDRINQEEVIGYRFNIIELDGVPHMLLTDRDIEYVIEDYD